MTTIEKIKQLLCSYRKLCCALGFLANTKDSDSDVFKDILEARDDIDKVIDALCDDLPDHIADLGKKVFVGDSRTELGLQDPEHIADLGKMMYGGQPVNLCAKEETK